MKMCIDYISFLFHSSGLIIKSRRKIKTTAQPINPAQLTFEKMSHSVIFFSVPFWGDGFDRAIERLGVFSFLSFFFLTEAFAHMAKYLNLKLELKVVKLCQPNNIQWYTFLTARTAN